MEKRKTTTELYTPELATVTGGAGPTLAPLDPLPGISQVVLPPETIPPELRIVRPFPPGPLPVPYAE